VPLHYPGNLPILFLSAGMLVYALLTGLLGPRAAFFPASRFNADWFQELTGMPVQIFRGLTALVMAMALWRHCMMESPVLGLATAPSRRSRFGMWLAWALLGIWLAAGFSRRWRDARRRRGSGDPCWPSGARGRLHARRGGSPA